MTRPDLACSDVAGHLPLFVGGDLEREVLEAVAGHVAACAECRDAWRRAVRAREAHVNAGRRAAGLQVDLWPGVRAGLTAAGLLAGTPAPVALEPALPQRWTRWPVWAAAASIALVWTLATRDGAAPVPSVPAETGAGTVAVRADAPDSALPVAGPGAPEEPLRVAADTGQRLWPDFEKLRKLEPGERGLGERAVYWSSPGVNASGLVGWPNGIGLARDPQLVSETVVGETVVGGPR